MGAAGELDEYGGEASREALSHQVGDRPFVAGLVTEHASRQKPHALRGWECALSKRHLTWWVL